MAIYSEYIPPGIREAIEAIAVARSRADILRQEAKAKAYAFWRTANDGKPRPFGSNRLHEMRRLWDDLESELATVCDPTTIALHQLVAVAKDLAKQNPAYRQRLEDELAKPLPSGWVGKYPFRWEDEELARELGVLPPR